MKHELSPDELIEEEFLKHASTTQICGWLSENADRGVAERNDQFQSLRAKYEPIWSQRKNKLLKLAVCRYGRNVENLKRLLFTKTLPDPYAFAILGNSALMREGGVYEIFDSYVTQNDVIKLYQLAPGDKTLFFYLFKSVSVSESFLTNLFRRDPPYHTFSDEDLFRVLYILFNHNRKYFSERSETYTNYYRKTFARELANAIVSFIWRSKEKAHPRFDASCNQFIAQNIRIFIDDSMSLGSDGISDIRVLMSFQASESLRDEDRDELEKNLSFIRFHLGNRAYANVVLTAQEDAISKLRDSDIGEVRSIFYRNAPLHLIYSASYWLLERFLEEIPQESLVNILCGDAPSLDSVSKESRQILGEISRHFERDKAGFAVSLALNRRHYTTKSERALLRELCRYSDSLGIMLPCPFGVGTCSDVFDDTCADIRRESPEYFDDDTLEARLLQRMEKLSAEVEHLKTLMRGHGNNEGKRRE